MNAVLKPIMRTLISTEAGRFTSQSVKVKGQLWVQPIQHDSRHSHTMLPPHKYTHIHIHTHTHTHRHTHTDTQFHTPSTSRVSVTATGVWPTKRSSMVGQAGLALSLIAMAT